MSGKYGHQVHGYGWPPIQGARRIRSTERLELGAQVGGTVRRSEGEPLQAEWYRGGSSARRL